ncbi:transmembrane protein 14 homolog [Anopheles maculipalpis]|uniref:transmembrane protein 14 homolog n=1 Tax=Anopheles maculipalpis TaxID=1496333 RepID=UPI00215935D0|nr:transmembrane protein 14 homolog [Anopheles maculipalpis]
MIDFVGIVFAILIVVGGVVGYMRAGSVASLYAGLVFGVAIGAGAWCNSLQEPFPYVQLFVLSVLIVVMMIRFYKTRAFMPPGMILLLSLCVMVWTVFIYGDYFSFISGTNDKPIPVNGTINVPVSDGRKLE